MAYSSSPNTYIKQKFLGFAMIFYFALLAFAPVGYAAPVSQEAADGVKATIEQRIKEMANVQKLAGYDYQWDGDVIVEPSGNFYAITLPYLKVKQESGHLTDIGMIAINTVPSDDGMWRVAVAIPTPIKVTAPNATGTVNTYEVNIGKQRMNGLFIVEAEQFLKLDGAYEDIIIKDAQGNTMMSAPQTRLVYDFNVVGEDLWSGKYSFSMSDLSMMIEEQTVSFGTLEFAGSVEEFSVAGVKKFQDQMQAASAKLTTENPDTTDQEAIVNDLANTMIEYITTIAKSSTGAFAFKNVAVTTPTSSEPLFKLDEFRATVDTLDMTSNASTISFAMAILGIDVDTTAIDNPMPASPDAISVYLPQDFRFKFGLKNIPTQKLLEKFKTDIMNAANDQTGTAPNPNLGMEFLQVLIDNDSRIFVENTGLISDLYALDINANLVPAPASPHQVKGTASATLGKLNLLMAQLQQDTQNTENQIMANYAQQALGMLTMVQMMGQQQPNGDDINYVYNFEIKENGDMLLNGSDLSQISAMMGGGAVPQ